MTTEATFELYPDAATFAQLKQFVRIRKAVADKTKEELRHAYFGSMVDSGTRLTPFQLAEIAASVARAAVLNSFAADGEDARDV
jgi:hypothetical protein